MMMMMMMSIYQVSAVSASKSSGFPKSATGGGFVPEPSVERDDPCLPAPPPKGCVDEISIADVTFPQNFRYFNGWNYSFKPFHAIPRAAFLAGSISIGKMVTKFHQLAASQHILAVMRGHLRSCRVYTLFQKVHAFVSDSDFWTPNVGELSAKNEGLRLLRWAMTSQPLNGLVVCPYVFVSCRMPLVAWKMSTSMTFSMWPDRRTQAASPSFFFVVRCATERSTL